ncbi:MAG: hypothetical protein FRX48_05756 [Lasallia pustulata]|uniref:Uncharacterized protein n=1 Tax=Lasallia pustulata TaxID=136370 RepID=A0A5M8PLJ3_9LECA|nr:MAG: hypothetical protein FRX48_05756 [Lasallia pustulata]
MHSNLMVLLDIERPSHLFLDPRCAIAALRVFFICCPLALTHHSTGTSEGPIPYEPFGSQIACRTDVLPSQKITSSNRVWSSLPEESLLLQFHIRSNKKAG